MATIKQITVGSTTYDLTGKYLLDSNGQEKSWEDITNLVEASFDIEVLPSLPHPTSPTAEDYENYHNKLVLVPQTTTGTNNYYDEYVIQDKGSTASPRYAWEQIGSTEVDLSGYVQKGSYTTQAVSGNTGEGGAQTITINLTGESANGSGTVTYDKATSIDSHTIAAHSHTVNANTASITYVNGVKNDGTVEVITGVGADGTTTVVTTVSVNSTTDVIDSITADTLTVATEGIKTVGLTSSTTTSTGAITYVEGIIGNAPAMNTATGYATVFITTITGFSGGSKAADTFTPNTPTSLDLTKFSGGTFIQGAKAQFAQGAKATLSYATLNNVMQSATVVNGVLSWTTATVSNINSWTANGNDTFTPNGDDSFTAAKLNTGFYSAGSAAQFSEGAFTPASLGTVTTKSVGVTGGSYSATIKYVKPTTTAASTTSAIKSITSTTTSVATGITTSTATALTGVKATGSATVILNTGLSTAAATFMTDATLGTAGATTLAHNINYTSTTASVNVSVPMDHSHTINVANHTHSLGNHTHDINLQNPNS